MFDTIHKNKLNALVEYTLEIQKLRNTNVHLYIL